MANFPRDFVAIAKERDELRAEVEHLRAYQQQMNDILKENATLRNDLTAARLDLEALRRCLRGVASCATCEVCRGAAQSHLHPTGDDALHNTK